jgi:hypothetical protein
MARPFFCVDWAAMPARHRPSNYRDYDFVFAGLVPAIHAAVTPNRLGLGSITAWVAVTSTATTHL